MLLLLAQIGALIYLNVLCKYALISVFVVCHKFAIESGSTFTLPYLSIASRHVQALFLSRFPKTVAAQCN